MLKAIERLKSNRENHKGKQHFLAMYSSIFGGITTDPAAMVIPIDDHMVHRGHGVFDTAAIMDGLVIDLWPNKNSNKFLETLKTILLTVYYFEHFDYYRSSISLVVV